VIRYLAIVGLLFALSTVEARSIHRLSNEEELAKTAEKFFNAWLLKRDDKQAMTFISAHPILGRCSTPDSLEGKKHLSNDEIRSVFHTAFVASLTQIPRVSNLSGLLDVSGGVSAEDSNVKFSSHSLESLFELFQLRIHKPASEVAYYVCKFDERKSFRDRVSGVGVFYMTTTLKRQVPCTPVTLEFLWVREGEKWRILTIAVLED